MPQLQGDARAKLQALYDEEGVKRYYGTTRPYRSVARVLCNIVNPVPVAAPTAAFLVVPKQQLVWFNYGQGDSIPWGATGVNKTATKTDTNQLKGSRTNGQGDFCIESISLTATTVRYEYPAAALPASYLDPDVRNFALGILEGKDPAALVMAPQIDSPANLEGVLFELIKPRLALTFAWDGRSIIPIGAADQIPEGGAKSFLHASGDPDTNNRFHVPEGYLWRAQGHADCDFNVQGDITDTLVLPVGILVLPDGAATPAVPTHAYLDIACRVHGVEFTPISQNV